jgi:hypothetical protein
LKAPPRTPSVRKDGAHLGPQGTVSSGGSRGQMSQRPSGHASTVLRRGRRRKKVRRHGVRCTIVMRCFEAAMRRDATDGRTQVDAWTRE